VYNPSLGIYPNNNLLCTLSSLILAQWPNHFNHLAVISKDSSIPNCCTISTLLRCFVHWKRFGIDEKMWYCEEQERGSWWGECREVWWPSLRRNCRRRKAAMTYPDVSNLPRVQPELAHSKEDRTQLARHRCITTCLKTSKNCHGNYFLVCQSA